MVINLSETEADFVDEVKGWGGKDILSCVQCGKCAATCPMALAGFTYFIKKLIQAITIGTREELMDDPSMWACQSCNRCVEICPQDVNPYEVLLALRRAGVRDLAVPGGNIEALRSLLKFGHAVYPTGYEGRRKEVGLSEQPPSTLSFPEALKNYRDVLRETELAEVAPFPIEEGKI